MRQRGILYSRREHEWIARMESLDLSMIDRAIVAGTVWWDFFSSAKYGAKAGRKLKSMWKSIRRIQVDGICQRCIEHALIKLGYSKTSVRERVYRQRRSDGQ